MTHIPPAPTDVRPTQKTHGHGGPRLSSREWGQLRHDVSQFVRRRIHNRADADDVTQSCFVRVYQALPTLRHPDQLRAWIYRSARHAVIDYYRKQSRQCQEIFDDETFDESRHDLRATSADVSAAAKLATCLPPSLLQLSATDRDALERVDLRGQSQIAAANALDVSVSGMKSRVQRARQRLKAVVERCCAVTLDRRGGVAEITPRTGACSCQPACACAS